MGMIRILILSALVSGVLPLAAQNEVNLALGKKVSASSFNRKNFPKFVIDGDKKTKWESLASDPQWLAVDLGREETVGRIVIFWENSFAKEFKIQLSSDGKNWEQAYFTKNGKGKKDVIRIAPRKTRYVRFTADQRSAWSGYAISEMQIFAK